jgi:hypothetical protein
MKCNGKHQSVQCVREDGHCQKYLVFTRIVLTFAHDTDNFSCISVDIWTYHVGMAQCIRNDVTADSLCANLAGIFFASLQVLYSLLAS